jgi:hypothetical protein
MQFKKAVYKRGAECFLVMLEKEDVETDVTHPAVRGLLDEFHDVFGKPPKGLPPDRDDAHVIPLEPGSKPVWRPMYRLSPLEHLEVKKQVAELLDLGWIEPSTSPYGSPVLFVSKKDGGLRMCIDFRALNKQTVKNRYTLPRIDDLIDQLREATVFSSLDLRAGYNQIRLQPEDAPKTAFRTPFGHYQYKVMCFGLTNAPATFQSVMNNLFRPYIGKHVLVYMDDILVFSKNETEHVSHLRDVLTTLRKNSFYAKASKCTFFEKELVYLGHIVGHQGVRPDPNKLGKVPDWPSPINLRELRSFLGFANYFRKYIKGYSTLVSSLTDLTKHSAAYVWTDVHEATFKAVKTALTSAKMLRLPDPNEPYTVVSDASGVGLGAVLLQGDQPIAFESRKLNDAEKNYTTGEQELLGVVHALRAWRCYLEGCRGITVVTDHKPNIYQNREVMLSRRQSRWMEFLQRFGDIQWVYKPGATNCADPLSRIPSQLVLLRTSRAGLNANEDSRSVGAHAESADASDYLQLMAVKSRPRPDVPSSSSHDSDLMRQIRDGYVVDPLFTGLQGPDSVIELSGKKHVNTHELEFSDGLWWKDGRIAIPSVPTLRQLIMRELHDPPYAGHIGSRRTQEAIARIYWWPNLAREVSDYVRSCHVCQVNKTGNERPGGLLQPLQIPERRWESVGMDVITGLPLTPDGHDAILTFVDRLSKMVHFVPTVTSCTAVDCAQMFVDNVFKLHGLPSSIVSDRDPRFRGHFTTELYRLLGTRQDMSTAFHPQTDGQAERANRIVEDMLRHYVSPTQHDWDKYLSLAEFAVNNAWQASIRCTPFEMNYGQHPLTPLTLQSDVGIRRGSQVPAARAFASQMMERLKQAKLAIQAAQDRQKAYADRTRRDVVYSVGDMILLSTKNIRLLDPGKNKLLPKWLGPFRVIEKVGPVAYRLDLPPTMKIHPVFHVSLLKPYRSDGAVQPPQVVNLPDTVDDTLVYEVEALLDHRDKRTRSRVLTREYLVKWTGYGPEHNTWEPERNLDNCAQRLTEYWRLRAVMQQQRAPKGVLDGAVLPRTNKRKRTRT